MLIALSISIFILKIIWFWIQQLVGGFLKLILPSNLENNVKFSFEMIIMGYKRHSAFTEVPCNYKRYTVPSLQLHVQS